MKILSARRKLRLFRLARRAAVRRAKRLRTASNFRTLIQAQRVSWANEYGSGFAYARMRTPMPENFCLQDNYEETAKILLKMRGQLTRAVLPTIQRGFKIPKTPSNFLSGYFDFATMKQCSPAAALIVASEYDRSKNLTDWSIPVVKLEKWSPTIKSTLSEVGFFKLLDIDVDVSADASTGVEIVQFMAGDTVSGPDAFKLVSKLADMLFGDIGEDADPTVVNDRLKVYGALIEAIENSILHAYKGIGGGAVVRRWWMTGAVDSANKHVNIVVYDQGLSIPATLPSWAEWGWVEGGLARLRRRLGAVTNDQGFDDAAKIRLAMNAPRSSTGHSNRGKGFPAFKQVLAFCRAGNLRIVSRRGEFLMQSGKKPVSKALKTPLTGTLVEWDLWL